MSTFTENWLPNIVTDIGMFVLAMYYGPDKARESADRLMRKIFRHRRGDVTVALTGQNATFVAGTLSSMQGAAHMQISAASTFFSATDDSSAAAIFSARRTMNYRAAIDSSLRDQVVYYRNNPLLDLPRK